jgi:hypothetical protein
MIKLYCTQNNGDCKTCSLSNYGLDCQNNPVGRGGAGRGQGRKATGAMPIHALRCTSEEFTAVKEFLDKRRKTNRD